MTIPGISMLEGKYMITMDPFPQQSKEFNRVWPFYKNLSQGRFTTTRCVNCGSEPFPPRIICPECLGEEMQWIDWPTEAVVIEVTEELVGIPLGFGKAPLVHALIDLGGKRTFFLRILNCDSGRLKTGDKVKLTVFPIDPVPMEQAGKTVSLERVFFAFEPAD